MSGLVLIGMLDSPFVRRVAVTLNLTDMLWAHRRWSVFRDYDRVSEHNPLGRVPILLLGSGEALVDTAAIIDFIDEHCGDTTRVLPQAGAPRRDALRHIAIAAGACEKAVALVYETKHRDAAYIDPAWALRLRGQLDRAMDWLAGAGPITAAASFPTQPQVTAAVLQRFVDEYLPEVAAARPPDALSALRDRLEATPAFRDAPFGE